MSKFILECLVCKEQHTVQSDTSEEVLDINKAAVLGMISTGGGHSQLEEFLAFCNIPAMSFPTFASSQDALAPHIHSTAHELMITAGKEEARLAKELGEVDKDGVPKIAVIADGAWCKRSYKSNYNASSGVVSIL